MNHDKIIIDDALAYAVTHEIMNDDYESRSIIECCQRHDKP